MTLSVYRFYLYLKFFLLTLLFITLVLPVPAAQAQRLVVDVSVANIRSGPGTKYEVLWRAERYTPLQVLDMDKTGKWCYFKDFEGTKAWVSKDILRKADSVITKKDLCNIRKGPGTNNDILFKAERGVPFKVKKRKGDWIQIQHADGEVGWIHRVLVW